MRIALVIAILSTVSCQEYVPGTPGGAWTREEMLAVRAKLWHLYTNENFVYKLANKLGKYGLEYPLRLSHDLGFFTAKVLRLSFHDCIRYEDGEGGCDGCLNWSGVGKRFPNANELKYKFKVDDMRETNNNGLEYVVAILEELYTNPKFPSKTPKLPASLKATGKSRADLWSFAAKVAVEFATEQNNFQCQDKPEGWVGQMGQSWVGNAKDCMRNKGEDDCVVNMDREIQFQFGRKDCVSEYDGEFEQYKTDRHERHPNPEGNGDATLDFFNEEFGFSGRETVAIMGAHTLGKMHVTHSLLKYGWTVRGGHIFNNAYYKNIVRKTDWFIQAEDGNTCTLIGDAYGNLPDAKWIPTMNGFTKSGGPMHWIRMNYACTYCGSRPTDSPSLMNGYDKCCEGKPEGLSCKPDNATRNDVDDIKGCEKYRFPFGKDEMMINAEAGLYFKFDEENGIPYNCPGLEHFNMDTWKGKNGLADTNRRAYHMDCPLNDRSIPADDKSVSEIITDYANNQAQWVDEFVAAFEKMMSNGYSEGELTDAPSSWIGVQCRKKNGIMICA